MGVFDDIQSDLGHFITDSDVFPGVESVVYKPRDSAQVTIYAQVRRVVPEINQPGQGAYIDITIRNHATAGVTTVTPGGDKVTIADRLGGTPVQYRVQQIIWQTAARWMLRIDTNG